MTWKEAFKEVKEESDLVLPDGSRIEILYFALIICAFVFVLLITI